MRRLRIPFLVMAVCLGASLTGGYAQNCDCIQYSSTTLSTSHCPEIDPTVMQRWTVCGALQPDLTAYGKCCGAFGQMCEPVLRAPSVTREPGQCKFQIVHDNQICYMPTFRCAKSGSSSLSASCPQCPDCYNDTECPPDHRCDQGECVPIGGSPILVSWEGNRIELTAAENGVYFDLDGDGTLRRIAWTAPGSGAAFLVLDRNANGWIDDGTELFGNFTSQPPSFNPNGFLALAVFDDPAHGGNGDGWITGEDDVFQHLQLWVDRNHDGVSQPEELQWLSDTDIVGISLDYKETRRRDRHGNEFRYMSEIVLDPQKEGGRRKLAVDVFFVGSQSP